MLRDRNVPFAVFGQWPGLRDELDFNSNTHGNPEIQDARPVSCGVTAII
jgi:hypothetical protein